MGKAEGKHQTEGYAGCIYLPLMSLLSSPLCLLPTQHDPWHIQEPENKYLKRAFF
jgi:hypothetical protein